MAVARIGADDDDDVRRLDRLEGLRARRGAQGLAEAVAGGRVADAGTGVHVVVAEGGAHQLLHEVVLLVGAAAGDQGADGIAAVFLLDAAKLGGGMGQRLVPRHLAPRVGGLRADHRLGDAIRMRRITPGEAALDAGVTLVGAALPPGHHAHDLVALELGAEAAADAAIGAGGDDAALGLALLDDRLLDQRRRRAGIDAGAAGDALRSHEGLAPPRRDARIEAATGDGQREGALLFLAGAHATVADDALGRVEAEIGIGVVHRRVGEVVGAGHAVAHLAQADHAGHGLQLAVAVGGAGQAVQRVVGDVQLHHVAAQFGQSRRLGAHFHAGLRRRRAGGGVALAALDLDQAETAGAERLERLGGAELGNHDARRNSGAQQRGAGRHGDGDAVDLERHRAVGGDRRGAEVDPLHRKSSGKWSRAESTG